MKRWHTLISGRPYGAIGARTERRWYTVDGETEDDGRQAAIARAHQDHIEHVTIESIEDIEEA